MSYKATYPADGFVRVKKTNFGQWAIRFNIEENTEEQTILCSEVLTPEKPTYASVVTLLIREEYSIDDELALSRQRNEKAEEWQTYYDYCEACKTEARLIIPSEEADSQGE